MRALLVVCVLAAGSLADTTKDPYASWRDPIAKIVGGAHDQRAIAQLTELGDSVGPRLTGSPGYDKAVAWTMAQLKAAGAQNVHVEKFELEHGWQRGTTRASIVAPTSRALHVETLGWGMSTPAGGVRGSVLVLPSQDNLPAAAQLKGKIVLFDITTISGKGRGDVRHQKMLNELAASGAVGMLAYGPRPNNVLGTGNPTYKGKVTPLPMAFVGFEDAKLMVRLAQRGPVTVELAITNTITGPIQVSNVVGELRGRDKPGEWIAIGAHLDSWEFATGTQDNGSGVVAVLQTARLLAASGPLRRTVRFVLFGGEEQGDVGSHAYVVAHAAELDNCIAMLNNDNGAGHVKGWNVSKREDVKAALTPLADNLLPTLGGNGIDMTLYSETDHFAFAQAGVPALDLWVDGSGYRQIHHTQADTIDQVEAHSLASGIAVMAVTAYAIAQSSQRLGPRLDRKALEDLFKPDGYDEYLKHEGWWK